MSSISGNIGRRLSGWKSFREGFRKFLAFLGPGYMIAVGYMDPGNWATDLEGGSRFGYSLLFVILISNFMAVVLQGLAIKLGVVTRCDLAQACRKYYPPLVNIGLYIICELAIVACDLAEVIGSAIALNMLFGISLPIGVLITTLDVLVILLSYRNDSVKSVRFFEIFVVLLVMAVGGCFMLELFYVKPDLEQVFLGFIPSKVIFTNPDALYISIGIVGATVMPHNLYLHSHVVKVRSPKSQEDQEQLLGTYTTGTSWIEQIRNSIKFSILDCMVALTFAVFINAAILIVSAGAFYYGPFPHTVVADLFDAHQLLTKYLGPAAGFIFAFALLLSGQSSTITATLAGQIVMEGFLGLSIRPWLRRLITRSLAIIPAMIVAIVKGADGLNGLLIASQVALSIQLPFAVIPLVMFTGNEKIMTLEVENHGTNPSEYANASYGTLSPASTGTNEQASDRSLSTNKVDFSNPWWLKIIATVVATVILGLNLYLLVETFRGDVSF
ncbi:natural resistance-associated macrophage protein [Basidiobolus meristosporus CBS 931.73]|uniref:Natural resistance-associated macrophage protein n=1 Tax=Basidiobolus meristosporus CBS 931.73 TaxID=1314790 RepID=A0A1Y1YAK6_9FUNG|nr:natural resistance-associated macrophage protein [Basidiobolus meristosporus CBS 931.73]|eukprot:ORX94993.1 natural resistance-associated macrophage protein [Basidiobolus meristosporus CBS 931.73]